MTVALTVIDRSVEAGGEGGGPRGVGIVADGSTVNDWPRVRDRLVASGQPSILIFSSVGSACFRGLMRQVSV